MLSNFQIDNKPLIQSFLVGQKEFIKTLQHKDMEQLRQRVIASSHLGPLKQEETKLYINYRLKEAGWTGGELFDAQAIDLIHDLTEGVPRRINVFCDRILLFGYLEEIKFFTPEHIKIVADELADEITSPIKDQKHEEVLGYSNEIQKSYANNTQEKPIPQLIPSEHKSVANHTAAKVKQSVSNGSHKKKTEPDFFKNG